MVVTSHSHGGDLLVDSVDLLRYGGDLLGDDGNIGGKSVEKLVGKKCNGPTDGLLVKHLTWVGAGDTCVSKKSSEGIFVHQGHIIKVSKTPVSGLVSCRVP